MIWQWNKDMSVSWRPVSVRHRKDVAFATSFETGRDTQQRLALIQGRPCPGPTSGKGMGKGRDGDVKPAVKTCQDISTMSGVSAQSTKPCNLLAIIVFPIGHNFGYPICSAQLLTEETCHMSCRPAAGQTERNARNQNNPQLLRRAEPLSHRK